MSSDAIDVIEEEDAFDDSLRQYQQHQSTSSIDLTPINNNPSDGTVPPPHPKNPIVIRGAGNMTVFGMNSRFDMDFPSALTGRLAPEEFSDTMGRVNGVLRKTMPLNVRWFVCGCLFCCCTLGCSLWPVVCLNKRTVRALEKTLDWENCHLYHKLGMNWRLSRQKVDASNLTEYVLLLEFMNKMPLLLPD